jgi:FKBP-type peptidyl-prolyl cis-trans isomerase FkpA
MRFLISALVGLFLLSLGCCSTKPQQQEVTRQEIQQPMMDVNRQLIKQESERINNYIERRKYEAEATGTGLRMVWLKKNTTQGKKPTEGDIATVKYKIELLDGTLCYSSDEKGARSFSVAADNVESGLHEGIQLMQPGEKAIMIMPPHLAHGMRGDDDKIPPLSTLVVTLDFVSFSSKK